MAILGAGSLGLMLCALSASAGARPIVLDPHPERLAAASRFGAAETVLADRDEPDVARVRELTGGRGADLAIEAVGRPEAWELAVAMTAPGGTANLFGGCAPGSSFTIPTARVHYEGVRVLGTYHHAPALHSPGARRPRRRRLAVGASCAARRSASTTCPPRWPAGSTTPCRRSTRSSPTPHPPRPAHRGCSVDERRGPGVGRELLALGL